MIRHRLLLFHGRARWPAEEFAMTSPLPLESSLLWAYDREFPGFIDYFQTLLQGYFSIGPRTHPLVAERMSEALARLGPEISRSALREFAEAGIFAQAVLSSDSQVRLFWTSPLMSVYRAAVGYAPGPEDDVIASMPTPVSSIAELAARQNQLRNAPLRPTSEGPASWYWSEALVTTAPELYLVPFLVGSFGSNQPRQGPLQGLDLGCGWGRAIFALRDLSELKMTGVDLNEDELALFRQLADNAGVSQSVEAIQADITELPFPDESFDFAISHVVLDLLSDDALERALGELLRCLKTDAPFYVDFPNHGRFCGAMMLQRQTRRGVIDLLHGIEAHGKLFQLAFHDLRVPTQFTFAVLESGSLPIGQQRRRPARLVAQAAARLRGEEPEAEAGWRERLKRRKRFPHSLSPDG